MKTLHLLFDFLMNNPEKSPASIEIDSAPQNDRLQSMKVVLIPFTTPNNQLQLFARRSRRFD
jgi:hypothetical protein